ncbi:hypothetical protein ACJ72_03517 [Emergomyces africanus]|uniref:N,N-dimethylformamidase beta subunit-like C-terminal domain-containing protein n=1 Tax=Emergomyces africanus TaxID=1955775 RepID=A0A1B7NZE1_9EURO|nr:hypothetical protein ACJ72_03517 [Emergomyces africanus]
MDSSRKQVRPHTDADYAWSRPGGLVEKPGMYPGEPEAWVYCDKFSYDEGDTVSLKTHTTADKYDIEIIRDGHKPKSVFLKTGLPGRMCDTPEDAYAVGCGWPEALSIHLEAGKWEPAYYLVIIRIQEFHGRVYEREGFFIVKDKRRKTPTADAANFVLIHATSTLLAYNDWGGANHYRGRADGYQDDEPTPLSSTQRPIARGMLRIPQNAPRETTGAMAVQHGDTPRFPSLEYSWYFRYSRHYADAGWATYERPFVVWAEKNGYRVHHLTQSDLQAEPGCLAGYKVAVCVGHDEYWSWEQRDTIDSFVEQGGRLARFGGNYIWQVRFDEAMHTQYCYKIPQEDPEFERNPTRVSTYWDWEKIGRPGAQTVGLTGTMGCYTRYGMAVPRGSGGFQVYRPHHWALEGTQLRYGDNFGTNPVNIAAFEVDGVDFYFKKGLPYPTGADGAPSNLEIIAMCPATMGERDISGGREPIGGPFREFSQLIEMSYQGMEIPEYLQDREYGSGMVASFTKEKGEVFCAGSCEWVSGLIHAETFTEMITKNVLDRFIGKKVAN